MSNLGYSIAVILEKFRDFDRVGAQLAMPPNERLSILNVSEEVYALLLSGNPAKLAGLRPELVRRLSYALPLMRRLAQAQAHAQTQGQAESGTPAGSVADARLEAAAA